MERPTKHKRMRSFFLHHLATGSCPGVTWVDKAEGLFKIPWYHINKIDQREISEKFRIYVEWAKLTGNYKEGDVPNYTVYKTQVRCALNKLDDFKEELQHPLKTQGEPCRIFRFTDWPETDHQAASPDSTSRQDVECFNPAYPQAPEYVPQSQVPNSSGQPNTSFQMIATGNASNQLDTRSMSTWIPCADPASQFQATVPSFLAMDEDRGTPETEYQPDAQTYYANPEALQQHRLQSRILTGDALQQVIMGPSTSADNLDSVGQPAVFPEPSTSSAPLPETGNNMELEELAKELFPYDFHLDLLNWSDFPHALLLDGGEPESEAQCVSSDTPVENVAASQTASHCAPETEHKMTIVLYYGQPPTKVMEKTVKANGCRLYFGGRAFDNTFLDEKMYGPKSVELPMPPLGQIQCDSEKQKKFIATTLDALSRGLVLSFRDGDIYAHRLCYCTVFACTAEYISHKLSRENSSPEKVFDFQNFKESLKAGIRQKPYFILTFAKDVNVSSENTHPLQKVLVHAYVYHDEARRLSESQPVVAADSLTSSEPVLSDLNSLDRVEQAFKKMSVA